MKIRQARGSDVDSIVELRTDAAHWLTSIGSDQWSSASIDVEEFRRRVETSVANEETWVAVDDQDNAVLGTIAVDKHTNPGLWSDDELADSLIIHRMIRSARSPSGTGRLLLQQAIEEARRAGRRWIRLDAWTTNRALHVYYESMGFKRVRTVEGHSTYSAALFEYPVFDEIPSEVTRPPIEVGNSDHGNPTPPDHWHRVHGLLVHAPGTHAEEGDLEVSADSPPLHLWHDGIRWIISSLPPSAPRHTLAKQVLTWREAALTPGRHYVIQHQQDKQSCRLILHAADTPMRNNPHEEPLIRKDP